MNLVLKCLLLLLRPLLQLLLLIRLRIGIRIASQNGFDGELAGLWHGVLGPRLVESCTLVSMLGLVISDAWSGTLRWISGLVGAASVRDGVATHLLLDCRSLVDIKDGHVVVGLGLFSRQLPMGTRDRELVLQLFLSSLVVHLIVARSRHLAGVEPALRTLKHPLVVLGPHMYLGIRAWSDV